MAGALGVRIGVVAAGKECGFYLGRKRGLCEGFNRGMTGSDLYLRKTKEAADGDCWVGGL